jgi:hypothetical protein
MKNKNHLIIADLYWRQTYELYIDCNTKIFIDILGFIQYKRVTNNLIK